MMTQQWNPDARLDRRTLLRGAAGFGLAGAAATLLPGCSSNGKDQVASRAAAVIPGKQSAAGPALETTSIRLHSIPPAICIAAEYMAEPFLREQGFTDVQYTPYASKDLLAHFAAGDIDFGIGYAAAFIPQIAAGAPLVMLGGVHVGCWEVFATGDIKSMRDFKGKTVAITGPTFTDGIFMAMTLANVGLDLRKDVKLVTYPPTEFARLLSSGEVDAVVAFPPTSNDLTAKGIGHVVLNSMTDAPWSGYYCCTAVVHRSWMEKNPVATEAALRAVLKGADAVAKDPSAAAHTLVAHGFTPNEGYAHTALHQMPYHIWRDFDPEDSVRFYTLRLKEAGIIDRTPAQIIKQATNFSYLAQLKLELGG
ncbi:MAG TPA: ABC transporter substrate-binding protein [Sporichthyaceae bacterium]|jgi:NitT/TauT family transport system substrate-binding protein